MGELFDAADVAVGARRCHQGRVAAAEPNSWHDCLEWDQLGERGQAAEAAGMQAALETLLGPGSPLLARIYERAARELLVAGRDVNQNLAWMYPEQAAAVVRALAGQPAGRQPPG